MHISLAGACGNPNPMERWLFVIVCYSVSLRGPSLRCTAISASEMLFVFFVVQNDAQQARIRYAVDYYSLEMFSIPFGISHIHCRNHFSLLWQLIKYWSGFCILIMISEIPLANDISFRNLSDWNRDKYRRAILKFSWNCYSCFVIQDDWRKFQKKNHAQRWIPLSQKLRKIPFTAIFRGTTFFYRFKYFWRSNHNHNGLEN